MEMDIEKYLTHHPDCTIMQDWSEAEMAFADTPERFRDESWSEAVEEMRRKKITCSCGLEQIKERFFSEDEIEGIRSQAYEAGFSAGMENNHLVQ